MNENTKPIIIQNGCGQDLRAFGNVLSVMLNGEQTGGLLAVMTELTPPGGGPPLHVHSRETEIFLVTEGRISYYVAGEWTEVGIGGVVYLPKGAEHTYRNIGETPSRHWIVTLPAGFENFFTTAADEFARPGGPDAENIVAIHHQAGIDLLGGQVD